MCFKRGKKLNIKTKTLFCILPMLCFIWVHFNLFQENAKLYTVYLSNGTKIAVQQHTSIHHRAVGQTSDKQIRNKKTHTKPTDLVSTWVEEVAQTDYVAVVQLSHDLQLPILQKERKWVNENEVSCSWFKKWADWSFGDLEAQSATVCFKLRD